MSCELSLVIPCLNEADTLATCIRKAHQGAKSAGADEYEIIVADNGSTDGSIEIAQAEGARVVHIPERGYGAALLGGINAAQGQYVIMGDADDSYDWSDIEPFVAKLRDGYDLVMGSRLRGKILPGAMPPLHRWLGNPVLTGIGNLMFRGGVSDFHCGMRGFAREPIQNLHLRTQGMEFATEIVVKAALAKLRITEVPITYYPDGRSRAPHLRTWRDGWRHLSFMLLLSPNWIFLYPGLLMLAVSVVTTVLVLPGPFIVDGIGLDVHTLLVANFGILLSFQLLVFWLISRLVAFQMNLLPLSDRTHRFYRSFSLNTGLLCGLLLILVGLLPIGYSIGSWAKVEFGELNYEDTLRWLVPGLTLVTLGLQVFFASFVIALFNFRDNRLA